MFKKDNEQDEQHSRQHQRMRASPHQYGQQPLSGETYDAATLRMRQFQQQQQQQRMQHMQNVTSHKPQYPNNIQPLSSIPEIYQNSPSSSLNIRNPASNIHTNASMNIPNSGSTNAYESRSENNIIQTITDDASKEEPATLSNVMEDLINIAESVVASKNSASASSTGPEEIRTSKETIFTESSMRYSVSNQFH